MNFFELMKPLNDEELENMKQELDQEETDAEKYYMTMNDEIKCDLKEYSLEIFNSLHSDSYTLTCEENFDEFMKNNVTVMLKTHIETVDPYCSYFNDIHEDILNIVLDFIVFESEKIFYTHVTPRRSYDKSFIRCKPNTEKNSHKIQLLRDKPQPEQRTNEWYETRHNMITASSIGKIFESQSLINSLIYEKCKPLTLTTQTTGGALGWGIKYEPISVMFYESLYNCKVEDFGCIQHDNYKFIGASPDGIVVSRDSNRYGRMLEIKNPISRQITGNPKKMYWIQMQMQMEVCNLNECDFLETKFSEYKDEDDFNNDGTFCSSTIGQLKGIILHFIKDDITFYEYLPIYSTIDEYSKWKDQKIQEYGVDQLINIIYYKLDHYSCVLVMRNKLWIAYAIPKIQEVWETIEKERIEGYQHRAPKERKKRSCMIDIETMKSDEETVVEMFSKSEPKENNVLKIRTESFDETISKMVEEIC